MIKTKSTSSESKRLSDLLASKEQVDHLVDYYSRQFKASELLYNAIQQKINTGYIEVKSLVFGFIPVVKKMVLDDSGIQQFYKELLSIKNQQIKNQEHYKFYVEKQETINTETQRIDTEINQNFELVLEQAKKISNPRLVATISTYDEKNISSIDKIAFFEYLKQEINNSLVHGNK